MNSKESLKSLRASAPGLIFSLVAYVLILIFRPPFKIIIGCACVLIIVTYTYKSLKHKKKFKILELLKQLAITNLILISVYSIYILTGAWGFLSTIIIVMFISGSILIRRPKDFIIAIRDIEKMIFGKSLDKKNFRRSKK